MRFLTLFSVAAAVYVFLRAVLPLRCRWGWKALLGALLITIGFYFKSMRLLGGALPFAPDLPGWFILCYSWLYLSMMAYFLVLIAAQALRLCVLRFVPAWKELSRDTRKSIGNTTHLALLIAVCLTVGIGELNATKLPQVHEVAISLPMPANAARHAPVRIALLADLHVDSIKQKDFIQAITDRVNALNPDLVLIVGDFVDGSVAQRGEHLEPLRGLKAPVYAVPGNHEYFSGYEAWAPYLSSLGIRLMHNAHEHLSELGITLAGVTDPAAALYDLPAPDVQKALSGAPAGVPIILMAHQPQHARQAEPAGVALQLSGHTHGGLMPGLAQITAAYNCGFVCGLYHTGNMQLYVSPGTSLWSGTPLRLGVPAEITLITLNRNDH